LKFILIQLSSKLYFRIRERRVEERILLGWRTRIREESRRKNITGMEN